jgi:hypothetical protein
MQQGCLSFRLLGVSAPYCGPADRVARLGLPACRMFLNKCRWLVAVLDRFAVFDQLWTAVYPLDCLALGRFSFRLAVAPRLDTSAFYGYSSAMNPTRAHGGATKFATHHAPDQLHHLHIKSYIPGIKAAFAHAGWLCCLPVLFPRLVSKPALPRASRRRSPS